MAEKAAVFRMSGSSFAIVEEYYKTCPHEPTPDGLLQVDRVEMFSNFFELTQKIIAARRSKIVVVTHGSTSYGLPFSVSPKSTVSAGYCLQMLSKAVDELVKAKGDVNALAPLTVENVMSVCELKKFKADALDLVTACYQIRTSGIVAREVHVRGCDIGASPVHIRSLRALFGSTVATAPRIPMFYIAPKIVEEAPSKWTKAHPQAVSRRRTFEHSGLASLVLDAHYQGATASGRGALEKHDHLRGWTNVFHETTNSAVTNRLLLAGLWPEKSYVLAHERADYVSHLEVAKSGGG